LLLLFVVVFLQERCRFLLIRVWKMLFHVNTKTRIGDAVPPNLNAIGRLRKYPSSYDWLSPRLQQLQRHDPCCLAYICIWKSTSQWLYLLYTGQSIISGHLKSDVTAGQRLHDRCGICLSVGFPRVSLALVCRIRFTQMNEGWSKSCRLCYWLLVYKFVLKYSVWSEVYKNTRTKTFRMCLITNRKIYHTSSI